MYPAPTVRTGYWENFEQTWFNRCQYTTSDRNNLILQLVIGVLFGAAWPLLCDILTRLWDWLQYFRKRPVKEQGQSLKPSSSSNERTPLIPGDQPPARSLPQNHTDASNPRDDNHDIESGAAELPSTPSSHQGDPPSSDQTGPRLNNQPDSPPTNQPAIPPNAPTGPSSHGKTATPSPGNQVKSDKSDKTSPRGWPATISSIILIISSVGLAVAGSFATAIPADSLGLSASKYCGSWSLKLNAGNEAMDNDDLIQAKKETRAGQYGRDCYGQRSIISPDQCVFFNSQSIPYMDIKLEQPCPFRDITLCAGGGYTAVRFSTGLVEASVLGINSPKPPKFNRTTICVPLDLNQGFVKKIPPDLYHQDYRFQYNLGPVSNSEYSSNVTFTMFGDPFKWGVPAYSVSVYEATPYPENNYWTPIRELDIMYPGRTYLTLMFISSCRIVYKGPSKDYIFYATEEYSSRPSTYWSTDPRARPLACIDWNEVCTNEGKCSPMDEEHEDYENLEYEFTRSALRKSTTFHAIQFRLGAALVAQESVGDFESLALDPNQWIIEANALYNTSLARIQFDALDIDQGVGHEKASYKLDNPDWARDKLCGMFRFQLTKGYTNINISTTIIIFTLVVLIFILAQETPLGFKSDEKIYFKGDWMVFDLILSVIIDVVCYIVDGILLVFRDRNYWKRGT